MTTTTGTLIDSEALLDALRELLRRELALGAAKVHPPGAGPTTSLTAGALDRVERVVLAVAEDLHGLAGALGRLVDNLVDQDGGVSAMFDLLTMRTVA